MKAFIVLLLAAVASAQINVQFPGRQPVQPPPQQQPNWQPAPPVRPNNPSVRNNWREGTPDSRCPNPDDTTGNAVFVSDQANPAGFRICWGQLSFPFSCPTGTVWWPADPTGPSCAFPSQIPAWNPQFPNLRPFDSENAPFAEDVADE